MSTINLNSNMVELIKKYCSSIDPNLDLSKYIKSLLSRSDVKVLDALENNPNEVEVSSFEQVVESFFEALDFCSDNFDSDIVLDAKNEIGYFFEYLDKLDLSHDYNFSFMDAFFSKLSRYNLEESRGIYDLLTMDVIRNSKIMNAYLESNYCKDNMIALFTKNLYKCFDSLEDDEIEKVKYVFHSSLETLEYFLGYPEELEIYFPYTIVSHFSKESLSLLFRSGDFYSYEEFFQAPEAFLEVIGAMCCYMVEKTGHCAEFLECLLPAFDQDSKALKKMIKVFEEYYDKYFYDGLDNNFENDEVFKELLSVILNGDCLHFFSTYNADTISKVQSGRKDYFDKLYSDAFGKGNYLSMRHHAFNEDFFEELDGVKLSNLKQIFFKRVFGITTEQARFLVLRYGRHLEECSSEFLEEDKDTLEILRTIKNVYGINQTEKEKIKLLQVGLYRYVKENGFYSNKPENSFVMLRSIIDRMYMKTFNKELFRVSEEHPVLYTQRGIPVIDAGVDFSMIVTAVNGVGDYYRNTENLLKRYNSSYSSGNQGICATFINNENLGVIGLNGPLIGFANLSDDSLNAMGVGDIYSCTDVLSLKNSNSLTGEGRFFLTPKQYADYSRFGYNEMVVDRFLSLDDDEKIKVQPSYIVCFKMDDNYLETRMYKRSIKMAQEFGVPLVLVDVVKVKEHERDVILEMERELFSSNKVNKDLMHDIITRYMNNYTGSLTMTRSRKKRGNGWDYKTDFSIRGLDRFIKKVERKFENLNIEEIKEWHSALYECYDLERRKNQVASEITSYGDSLDNGEFVLDDDIYFMDRINAITDRNIDWHYIREGKIDINNVVYNPRLDSNPELTTLVNIGNQLLGKAFVTSEDSQGTRIFMTNEVNELSDEEKINCGLIVSYLLGDYHHNYFADFNQETVNEMRFDYNRHYIREEVSMSGIYGSVTRTPELINMVKKITSMNEKDYIRMMKPLIEMVVSEKGVSTSYITKKLIGRKDTMDSEFRYLKVPEEKTISTSIKK